MSNYSTGELAKLCNVTTRTIQYYDRKGILKPQGFADRKASCVYRTTATNIRVNLIASKI